MATEKKKNKEIEEKASLKTEKKESKVSVAEKKKIHQIRILKHKGKTQRKKKVVQRKRIQLKN